MGFYYTYVHFLLDFGTGLSFNEKILIDVDFYEGFLSVSLLCPRVIICQDHMCFHNSIMMTISQTNRAHGVPGH